MAKGIVPREYLVPTVAMLADEGGALRIGIIAIQGLDATNVQDALAELAGIGGHADATETQKGIVRFATDLETNNGVSREVAVHPRGLWGLVATDGRRGLIQIATAAETLSGAEGRKAVTPTTLRQGLSPNWQQPVLLNSWTNFGAPWADARYRKTASGEVQLRGLIGGGTKADGTVIFTLPAGYRPAADQMFASFCASGACRINVLTDGSVTINSVDINNFLTLEGVRFDAV